MPSNRLGMPPPQGRLGPLVVGQVIGTPTNGVATRVGGVGEVLQLHRLQVGWQREDRQEGILGALERVLERCVSLERWERNQQETVREPRQGESQSAQPMSVSPLPEALPGMEAHTRGDLHATGSGASSSQKPGHTSTTAPRAQALMELVERIEACVRDGRPALSMELSGTGWTVDLERHALGGVVLRLQTSRGARGPDLDALRAELRARGVSVRELTCRVEGRTS